MATASLVRAEATTDESDQQKGLVARPPEVDAGAAPSGDIRPVLGGVPEVYSKGKVALTHSGIVDTARFGWVRDGDTETTDLQMRQSPMVVGRVPALIDRNTDVDAGVIGIHNRPRLLALASGDVLLLWVDAIRAPIFAGNGQGGQIKIAKLNATGEWDAAAIVVGSTTYLLTGDGAPNTVDYIIAADLVQFPDTGEIVMIVATQEVSTGSPTDRRIYTFHSDDDGSSWNERARYFLAGSPPDLLDLDGDGITDDATPITDIAIERADSGRLVAMLCTEDGLWSLTSDTRGSTWKTSVRVEDAGVGQDTVGRSVNMTRLRNGMLGIVRGAAAETDFPEVVLTPNGEDFSSMLRVAEEVLGTDVAIVTRPDGYPMIFGTFHLRWVDKLAAPLGWLWSRAGQVRDPGLDTTIADWRTETSADPVDSLRSFHLIEGLSGIAFSASTPNLHLGGFVGIDVIEWRGQLLMATSVLRQDSGSSGLDPDTLETSMMVYRLNHWQPIQEKLSNVYDSGGPTYYPLQPGRGYVYNRTWDCYTNPINAGFSAIGVPTSTVAAGGADDGYFEVTNPAVVVGHYRDVSLPNPDSGHDGMVRAIMRVPDSGDGDVTLDEIVLILRLRDAGLVGYEVKVRIENTGADQKVVVLDSGAPATIGLTGTYDVGSYIELLVSMYASGGAVHCTVAARDHVEATDPDFDNPYDLLVDDYSLTSLGSVANEYIDFGHWTTTDVTSRWKGVHLHRAQALGVEGPLFQRGATYIDTDTNNVRSATGGAEGRVDSGVDNQMRTSQATATPTQYVERGLEASFRGEALTEGNFDYETGYRFPVTNVFALPRLAEWRSMEDSKQIELVFDADPDTLGYRWRPEAVAVFGRNFPAITVQMHASDSWGPPDFERTFGHHYSGHSFDRTTSIWSLDLAVQSYFYEKRRLTIYDGIATPLTGIALWREHQFRSTEGSTRYYLVGTPTVGSPRVWEIEDNTEDTLILREEPDRASVENTLNTFDLSLAIYSSTFAAPLDLAYPTSFTDAGILHQNYHPKGYRYLRLLIPGFQLNVGVSNASADDFARLGYVMLGRTVELSGPDPSWGWTKGTSTGVELSYGRRGASSVVRSAPPRRSVTFDYLAARPPPEPTAEDNSPRAPSLDPSRASWDRWWSIVRRLEVEGTPVALVWEADRMHEVTTGDGGSMVPRTPEEVMLARVTSPGEFTHVAYECVPFDQTTVDGDTTVIRPIAATRGIVFTEEL